MNWSEFEAAVQDLFQYKHRTRRDLTVGRVLAPILLGRPWTNLADDSEVAEGIVLLLNAEIAQLRNRLNLAPDISTHLSAEDTFRADLASGHATLSTLSILSTYYVGGVSVERISDICAISTRRVHQRIAEGRRLLAQIIFVDTSSTKVIVPTYGTEKTLLKVFLCHASNDKERVRELYRRLSTDAFDPWLDEEKLLPGQKWEKEINKAVRDADIVIICLSHASINKKGFVQREIRYALDIAQEQPEGLIYIIPLRFEECMIPEELRQWHWVNYFEQNGYDRLKRALMFRSKEAN